MLQKTKVNVGLKVSINNKHKVKSFYLIYPKYFEFANKTYCLASDNPNLVQLEIFVHYKAFFVRM